MLQRRGHILRITLTRAVWLSGFLLASVLSAEARPGSRLEELLRYETRLLEQRADSDHHGFGTDPFAISYISETQQTLLLLRNASEILLLDSSLRTVDRKSTPRAPHGWTLVDGSYLWVVGELSNRIALYQVKPGKLVQLTGLSIPESAGLRDIAYVPSSESLFAIDAPRRQLIQVALDSDWRSGKATFQATSYLIGAGPLQIKYTHGYLFLNLLLDHRVDVIPMTQKAPDFSRKQSIVHNGPIWSFDTIRRGDSFLLAAVGVENRSLDRTQGEFGHIDSFLFLYELAISGSKRRLIPPRQLSSWNLSAQGIVTPKTVRFEPGTDRLRLWIIGFGSGRGAVLDFTQSRLSPKAMFAIPPGTTDITFVGAKTMRCLLAANTLLDAVYELAPSDRTYRARRATQLSLDNRYPSTRSRVGELLFFTTLLTPHNQSEGYLSRFTCETCHFEGTIDGRTHYTGRDHVFATTRPLRGLANNVPLFSRGGDRSLASMVLAEFRVANQKRQDNFSLDIKDYPWLRALDNLQSRLEAMDLRKSFLSFFVDFQPTPNPWVVTRKKLEEKARKGMEVFRAQCEYCHLATPTTRSGKSVTLDEWEAFIEDESRDLVWGAPFYTKTNILPYVSTKGARVPSLRRVAQKYPYFTNGSSKDLHDVLKRFRHRGATAWHHYDGPDSPDIEALSAEEVNELEALLRFF